MAFARGAAAFLGGRSLTFLLLKLVVSATEERNLQEHDLNVPLPPRQEVHDYLYKNVLPKNFASEHHFLKAVFHNETTSNSDAGKLLHHNMRTSAQAENTKSYAKQPNFRVDCSCSRAAQSVYYHLSEVSYDLQGLKLVLEYLFRSKRSLLEWKYGDYWKNWKYNVYAKYTEKKVRFSPGSDRPRIVEMKTGKTSRSTSLEVRNVLNEGLDAAEKLARKLLFGSLSSSEERAELLRRGGGASSNSESSSEHASTKSIERLKTKLQNYILRKEAVHNIAGWRSIKNERGFYLIQGADVPELLTQAATGLADDDEDLKRALLEWGKTKSGSSASTESSNSQLIHGVDREACEDGKTVEACSGNTTKSMDANGAKTSSEKSLSDKILVDFLGYALKEKASSKKVHMNPGVTSQYVDSRHRDNSEDASSSEEANDAETSLYDLMAHLGVQLDKHYFPGIDEERAFPQTTVARRAGTVHAKHFQRNYVQLRNSRLKNLLRHVAGQKSETLAEDSNESPFDVIRTRYPHEMYPTQSQEYPLYHFHGMVLDRDLDGFIPHSHEEFERGIYNLLNSDFIFSQQAGLEMLEIVLSVSRDKESNLYDVLQFVQEEAYECLPIAYVKGVVVLSLMQESFMFRATDMTDQFVAMAATHLLWLSNLVSEVMHCFPGGEKFIFDKDIHKNSPAILEHEPGTSNFAETGAGSVWAQAAKRWEVMGKHREALKLIDSEGSGASSTVLKGNDGAYHVLDYVDPNTGEAISQEDGTSRTFTMEVEMPKVNEDGTEDGEIMELKNVTVGSDNLSYFWDAGLNPGVLTNAYWSFFDTQWRTDRTWRIFFDIFMCTSHEGVQGLIKWEVFGETWNKEIGRMFLPEVKEVKHAINVARGTSSVQPSSSNSAQQEGPVDMVIDTGSLSAQTRASGLTPVKAKNLEDAVSQINATINAQLEAAAADGKNSSNHRYVVVHEDGSMYSVEGDEYVPLSKKVDLVGNHVGEFGETVQAANSMQYAEFDMEGDSKSNRLPWEALLGWPERSVLTVGEGADRYALLD